MKLKKLDIIWNICTLQSVSKHVSSAHLVDPPWRVCVPYVPVCLSPSCQKAVRWRIWCPSSSAACGGSPGCWLRCSVRWPRPPERPRSWGHAQKTWAEELLKVSGTFQFHEIISQRSKCLDCHLVVGSPTVYIPQCIFHTFPRHVISLTLYLLPFFALLFWRNMFFRAVSFKYFLLSPNCTF